MHDNEADFLAGRDLAVEMLQAVKAAGVDACMIDLWRTDDDGYGGGRVVIIPFLKRLRDLSQHSMEGFAAVLADMLGTDCTPSEMSHYSNLSYAVMTGLGPRLEEMEPPESDVIAFPKGASHG